jgi:hypothetical protein
MYSMAYARNQDRGRRENGLEQLTRPLLPDEKSQVQNLAEIHEERRKLQTLGIAEGCSRLFPAVLGTRDRKRTAGTALRSFCVPIRTFDVDPAARHIFAFSQSAATVMSRPAATLTIVSRRTLNPRKAESTELSTLAEQPLQAMKSARLGRQVGQQPRQLGGHVDGGLLGLAQPPYEQRLAQRS